MKSQTDRRRSISPAASLALAAALAPVIGGCDFLGTTPPDLHYRVRLTPSGARVSVEVRGGPRGKAWAGFGATALGPSGAARRVVNVAAHASDGSGLPVRPVGEAAYSVEIGSSDPWTLEYELDLGALPIDVYHRASSRSPRHLVLVGADALARFYGARRRVDAEPTDRPPGAAGNVTVSFDTTSIPEGWRVVSAETEVALDRYQLTDYPSLSVFAVGPYRVQPIGRDTGVRAAIHSQWTVARTSLANIATQLLRVLGRELGPPPGDRALLLFTPFPPGARAIRGVRTAGMAWDHTLVLFAGTSSGAPATTRATREMVAIFVGHELCHLYLPWGVPITEQLSWLSEGWAMHMGRRTAIEARLITRSAGEAGLRDAYRRYNEMGGYRAGSLGEASAGGEEIRELLYLRGELVFRIMALEWEESGKPGSFDAALWRRLQVAYDGESPLQPDDVLGVLSALVNPNTVRRFVEGTAIITLPDLGLR